MINLLLLDDHAMFREGLARTIEKEPDMRVVANCETSTEAIAALSSTPVSMVLLDVDLGNERALDFVERARTTSFRGPILVLTAGMSDQEAVRLLQEGVAGILHKKHSGQTLCDTIRKTLRGEAFLEEKYLTSVVRSVDRTRAKAPTSFTERERILLRSILEGMTNREIGDQLGISEGAVKASLRLLFEKVNVRTRAQLVKVALQQFQDQL